METVHGFLQEEIDPNAPPPEGKPVHLSSFADANLLHDVVTGRSASGIVEFIDQMPIDWFSKQQDQINLTAESSHGSGPDLHSV